MTSTAAEPVGGGNKGEAGRDQLVMVNLSAKPCTIWLNAMREAGQPWYGEVIDDLVKAKAMLQKQPYAHFLICYDTPERQIANDIGNGRLPSQALASWQNQVKLLLDLYHQHYQRVTLVVHEALFNRQKALFDQLTARSGIALGRVSLNGNASVAGSELLEEQHVVLHRLMGLQALQYPPAKRLAQELEASSLPLLEPEDLFDFLDQTYSVVNNSETKINLDDLQQENDLLIRQLHMVQEELEQYLQEKEKDDTEIIKLKNEIKRKKEEMLNLTQKNNNMLAQLKAIRSSKSWKLTAPLRRTMMMLGGKKGGGA
ncbi:hypothetical protein [Billgrantia sp. C5P2]|uniref:hypothetical protein n=1 Tax=Billgrantia sp. C5P2 TaxID=3436239 RepID=UPI003DA39DD5